MQTYAETSFAAPRVQSVEHVEYKTRSSDPYLSESLPGFSIFSLPLRLIFRFFKKEGPETMLGALQTQVDLQGVFVKMGDLIKFKGLIVEFLENKRS